MVEWALYYATLRWYVIPCWWPTLDGRCMCGDPGCLNVGKHPIGALVPNGEKDATISEALIRAWWTRYPDANVGVCAGPSGLLIIDCESDQGYLRWLDLLTTYGVEVPPCYEQATGGGGIHQFWSRGGRSIRSANRFMEEVDRKGNTGYVIMAPSLHRSGRRYLPMRSDRYVTPEVPEVLATTLATMRGGVGARNANGAGGGGGVEYNFQEALTGGARRGYRDQFFNDLAFKLKREGHAPEHAVNVMRAAWDACENPEDDLYPWDVAAQKLIRIYEDDNIKTDWEDGSIRLPLWQAGYAFGQTPDLGTPVPQNGAQGGYASGSGHTPSMIVPPEPDAVGRDVLNAQRLADVMGHQWLWTPALGWCFWSGRWHVDEGLQVQEYAKEVSRRIAVMAATPGLGDERRQQLLREAGEAGKMASITAMISAARSDPRVYVPLDLLDSDPWLLAASNGVIDLRTGQLRGGQPQDYITLGSNVAYERGFTCDRFEGYLKTSFGGDDELVRYVQRVVGSVLVGRFAEKALYVLIGPADSGKTTFTNLLQTALGSLAMYMQAEHLLMGRTSGGNAIPAHEIARMRSKRLVVSDEPQKGARWAEGLLKQLTGDDVVVGCFKYKDSFEIRPTWAMLIAANRMPRCQDAALIKRIRPIPMTPPPTFDPSLATDAHDPASDVVRAFLAWAVEGCLAWQRDGIGMVRAVHDAASEYQIEQDAIGEFIEAALEEAPAHVRVKLQNVHEVYRWWTEARVERPLGYRNFKKELDERGCTIVDGGREGLLLHGYEIKMEAFQWPSQGV